MYENQEFSTNNQSFNKINALNIIGFARFLLGISVFYFNSVLYFICDTITTLVGSCFVPRESTIKRNVANLFKLWMRPCAAESQWSSHDSKDVDSIDKGKHRDLRSKKEKLRLRPVQFWLGYRRLHDLWPGEARRSQGSPGTRPGDRWDRGKYPSGDKFCIDCIFLIKYYSADAQDSWLLAF